MRFWAPFRTIVEVGVRKQRAMKGLAVGCRTGHRNGLDWPFAVLRRVCFRAANQSSVVAFSQGTGHDDKPDFELADRRYNRTRSSALEQDITRLNNSLPAHYPTPGRDITRPGSPYRRSYVDPGTGSDQEPDMPSLKLTKTACEAACPGSREYGLRDTALAGLIC